MALDQSVSRTPSIISNSLRCSMLFQSAAERPSANTPWRPRAFHRESITLVWLNPHPSESKRDSSTQTHFQHLNCDVLFYTDKSSCVDYFATKTNRYEHIILVIEGAEVFDEALQCDQVKRILLVQSADPRDSSHSKMVTVCDENQSMVGELEKVIAIVEHEASQQLEGVFNTLDKKERALRDLHNRLGSSIWCRAFRGE